jgi:hypothetical protein
VITPEDLPSLPTLSEHSCRRVRAAMDLARHEFAARRLTPDKLQNWVLSIAAVPAHEASFLEQARAGGAVTSEEDLWGLYPTEEVAANQPSIARDLRAGLPMERWIWVLLHGPGDKAIMTVWEVPENFTAGAA